MSVAFSPDGKKLATSAAGLGALVWDVETGRAAAPAALQSTPSGSELSRALVFMAGLGSIATAATKGGVGYLIVPGSGTTLTNDFFCPVAISPDGKLLAVIQRSPNIKGDFQVEIYSLGSREKVAEYFSGISALAFSPDSKTLVVSGFFRAILIDPYTGKELPTSTRRNQ